MGGMKILSRACMALVFAFVANSFAGDVRESAIPEDARFNVMVEYETPDLVRKNVRLAMEAEYATEQEILDSLKTVPKGGYIYFQVKTSQIKKGTPRKLTYSLYDGGKKPIFKKTAYDTEAVPSEQNGVSNLLVIPVYGQPKSNVMLARVEARDGMETLDIDIPVR